MKDRTLNLILSGLRMAVIALGVLLVAIIVMNSAGDGETYREGEENYGAFLDGLFYIIYAVGISCAGAAVLFGLYNFVMGLVNDFTSKLGTLVGLLVFVGIAVVSYLFLSDPTVLNAYEASGITVTAGESVFAGGSMIFVYILGVAALVSVVWAEVSSIFK